MNTNVNFEAVLGVLLFMGMCVSNNNFLWNEKLGRNSN